MAALPSPASLPSHMKAQLLTEYNKPYSLQSVPLPVLDSPHDLLIRVEAASYCHTDAVLAAGQMRPHPPRFPHIACHEFAGVVVALPPTPTPTSHGHGIGDRVAVPGRAFHPCGECFECASGGGGPSSPIAAAADPDADPPGYSVRCARGAGNCGISAPGGFAEYAVVDGRQVAAVPRGVVGGSVAAAPLMCAGVTVVGALKRTGVGRGGRVGIVGCGGGLGHLGLQFAVAMGMRVVGVDAADGPLVLARTVAGKLGDGVKIVDARAVEARAVREEVGAEDGKVDGGDMGLDAVIILPESQDALDYGVALLRDHGRCVVVSFPEKGFHISARDLVFRDISIVGSLVGSNRTLKETLQLAAEHKVEASIKTFPLSRLNELVAEYHKGEGGKLVVDMSLPDE